MPVKTIFPDCVRLKGKPVIRVGFGYDSEIIKKIKTIPGAVWSLGDRKWLVAESDGILQELQELFSDYRTEIMGRSHIRKSEDPREQQIEMRLEERHRYMRSRRYGENTIKTYTEGIRIFMRFLEGKLLAEVTLDDVIRFNNDYILRRGLSQAFQNQVVNGLKLFIKIKENKCWF